VCGLAAALSQAEVARSECRKFMRLDRWRRSDEPAIRAEVIAEWGLMRVSRSDVAPVERPIPQRETSETDGGQFCCAGRRARCRARNLGTTRPQAGRGEATGHGAPGSLSGFRSTGSRAVAKRHGGTGAYRGARGIACSGGGTRSRAISPWSRCSARRNRVPTARLVRTSTPATAGCERYVP
jgi:hypothetical protein